jgi:myo-inositol-1(or 4)-monophosphatase
MSKLVQLVHDNLGTILEHRYEIEWKADGSPVTQADFFIEELISKALRLHFPDVFIIGEESYREKRTPDHGYIAVIDPIDGTENFCSGLKEWGVAFSLWKDRSHLGSLLLMPELSDMLMTGQTVIPLRSRIEGLSSSMNEDIRNRLAKTGEYRIMGCSVYNLFNVIRGAYAQFSNPKGAYIWDILPGLMLALEHNCEVNVNEKPFNGEFLDPNQRHRIHIQHRHDLHSR